MLISFLDGLLETTTLHPQVPGAVIQGLCPVFRTTKI